MRVRTAFGNPGPDASMAYARHHPLRPSIWQRGTAALGAYAACWLAMAAPWFVLFLIPRLAWFAFAAVFLMPVAVFAYQLACFSRGQTIAHAIAGMVVLDSAGTGASAGLGTMLFKYWFVMPLSHSTTIGLVINAYLIVQSSSAAGSGTRTVEDQLCNVVVAFRQERARKTVGI